MKADLKAKKDCFEESRKRSSNPGAKADAKVAEDAKKAEEESPLKKLFAVVMNADEILAKMK